MAGIGNTDAAPPSLSQLFLRGWEARRKVDACELTSGSPEHLECVTEGVAALEHATQLANQMSLFSDNEDLEEVATSSMKYLLLPAVLGELSLQTAGDRMDVVRRARVYFVDYLRRCRSYGITKDDPPPPALPSPILSPPAASSNRGSQKSYDQLASARAAKIQRLREKKELERRTEALTAALSGGVVGRGGGEEEEEEGGREQWVAMLKLGVYRSQEFVTSIDEEVPILRHMEAQKKGEVPVARKPEDASGCSPVQASPRQPMKPLVITREMVKGQVFGAGYPSLPTMSVEEFFQQKYGDCAETGGAGGGGGGEGSEGGDEGREEKEEEDSEVALKKAREWDDFKDENRRGWGNKRNMG